MNEPEPFSDPQSRLAAASPMTDGAAGSMESKTKAGVFTRIIAWIRRTLGWLTMGYLAGLLLLLVALEWWGERNWMLSILLYAPPQILLLPLVALTPACLLFRWRLMGWHFLAAAGLCFSYMNFRWSFPTQPGILGVTVVTFNAGESNRPQFLEFIAREKPDLILLQDMHRYGNELPSEWPGMFSAHLGQFSFLSRFPLEKPAIVERAKWNGDPVAMRCEAVIAGRLTALYSVHLPTPRRELSRFLGGRRILGDLVGQTDREPVFGHYREWLAARIVLTRDLARVFAEEPLPMIIGGDFNTPDHGYIYRLFAGEMTDAFSRAGQGWGLTFPGATREPVSYFSPWLRIDYLFVGRGWEVTECRPEPGRKSQHKAVFARLEPRPMD